MSGLPPTAKRILDAAKTIVAERGFSELTMTVLERESGANRALVSYYFGGKAGLVAALVDSLFKDPDSEGVEEIHDRSEGSERALHLLEWQERVSANDRVNRTLYELLPHALRDPQTRERFADEYRLYRAVDAGYLASAREGLSEQDAQALAAVSIAVVEGLGIQRALDPDGFDHKRAWRMWREVIGRYLRLLADTEDERL
jgi:AcrR family transcriptional regulator